MSVVTLKNKKHEKIKKNYNNKIPPSLLLYFEHDHFFF
jgi:hypothetical protein